MKVNNAIIMAAGTASRFAPLSYERHKALITVRGEILIERQIRQLREAGIEDIIVVTGYKAEQFEYLTEKYGVRLVHNADYCCRNNNSSIFAVKSYLCNSYICSSDNYFEINPFRSEEDGSYYSAVYQEGETDEWCIECEEDVITDVKIGGQNAWIMLGHVFWDQDFSNKFLEILTREYDLPETRDKLWETIYIEHIRELKMKIRKYPDKSIFEFDTLDELRKFDSTYIDDTRSTIIKAIASQLGVFERDIANLKTIKNNSNEAVGFSFSCGQNYRYYYDSAKVERV